MKTDEQIDKMKSKLTKVLKECNSSDKEQAIKLIQELGVDKDMATKLLQAFGEMQSAKKTAENVWNAAWSSTSGIDFSTDIEKSSNTEVRMTRYFNDVQSRCALIMAINEIEPNEINNEILDQLYEQGIRENEITNPALKITYHYYSENKEKDAQLTKAARREENLNEQLQFVEGNYTKLNEQFKSLLTKYEKLQNSFKERLAAAEKQYQAALSQISGLREKVGQLQNRGILKTIGDKLTGLLGNKRAELPETITILPDTLYENSAEKMGLRIPGDEDLGVAYTERNNERTATVDRADKDKYER